MKSAVTIILSIFLFITFSAKGEDTVFVAVEDTTVWENNDTSYVTEANFPSADEDFRQIWLNVHMSCPDGHEVGDQVITNCGEWDYSVQIQVLQEREDGEYDTVEIARGATPYAHDWTPDWYHRWTIDVTDYAPLFDENTKIRSFFHGSTEGFLAFFDFEMVRGTPPREPLSVQEIYSNPNHEDARNKKGWPYGYDHTDVNNDHLVPTTLTMPDGAESAMARVSIKGHGFGEQAGNCAEFCPKHFYLFKDQEQFVDQLIWRNNCDLASVFPQGGNWISQRTNWCPGMFSYTYDHEIPDVSSGESFEFEMDIEEHNNQPPSDGDYTTPRWLTDVQWFTYGPKNFDLNAGVKRIIAPSKHPDHLRFNPICDRPIIEIRNRGAETLESVDIEYGTEGGWKRTYTWEGSLDFMESDTVQLPGSRWGVSPLFSSGGPFKVTLSNPNGGEDEEPESSTKVSYYEKTPKLPGNKMSVLLQTKADRSDYMQGTAQQETSWFVYDNINDDTVAGRHRHELDFSSQEYDTVRNLEPGCYTFQIWDAPEPDRGIQSQSDGLSYFAFGNPNSYWGANPNGGLVIRDGNNQNFKRFTSYSGMPDKETLNFGRENSFSFTVGKTMDADEKEPFPESEGIKLYPNPVQDELNIELPLKYKAEMTANVYSLAGQNVLEETYQDGVDKNIRIDVSSLNKGTYILQLNTENEQHTEKFIIN